MAYVGFTISNSVSQKKWTRVYEEALDLADKLNLADWGKFYYKGIRHYAYCKVKEQTEKEFDKEKHFWLTCGEYDSMGDGEYFRLEREINTRKYNKDAFPAILSQLWDCNNEEQFSNRAINTYRGSYYIRLLSIFCFMESRLKEKMFISGDIDKSDCESAVKIANQFLKKPIEVPARCNFNRLYEIVNKTEISDEDKLFLMEKTYLGDIDLKYKKNIEEKFDKKVIKRFWKNRFKKYNVESYEFKNVLKSYLSYGFDFKDLFSYISFKNTKEEYLKLLELIIEIENTKNKFSRYFGITRDPKDNGVRGFSLEFRHSLFGSEASTIIEPMSAKKPLYKNYTFDDYVNELSKYFGNHVNVKKFLKEKIKDENEDTVISKIKEYCRKDSYSLFEGEENFDIIYSPDLMFYKTGDKIAPRLLEKIKEAVITNNNRLEDKEFKDLSEKETTEQIYELIDMKQQFPVRDIDWHHAIDYFNSHSDALERYYPLFCMKFSWYTPAEDIARALFINDEFYEFCKGV